MTYDPHQPQRAYQPSPQPPPYRQSPQMYSQSPQAYVHPVNYNSAYGLPPQKLNSPLGTASLAIAILTGVAEIALIVTAGVMAHNAGGEMKEDSPAAMAIGCSVLFGLLVAGVGLILGIVALCLPDRKKVLALLGVIFNGCILLAVLGLLILGLSM